MHELCLDHSLKKRTVISTAALAVLSALAVCVIRLDSNTVIPFGDQFFAYSDSFVMVAAGIGGMGSGMLSFCILFIVETVKTDGSFTGLYALSTYLIIIMLASCLAHKGFFKGWKKPLVSALLLASCLAFLWLITFTLLLSGTETENAFSGIGFRKLFICALPESLVSAAVITAWFRFAPEGIKLYVGAGWRYVESCECNVKGGEHSYVLARRVIVCSLFEAGLLCIAAIIFSDIQQAIREGRAISFYCIFASWRGNLQLALLHLCADVPLAYGFNLVLMKYVITPINEMAHVMEHYFAGDNTALASFPDLDIHSGDEIENLYKSLRKMVADMAGYLDMWERQAQLESDLKLAANSNKAKSDFLSSMSHEIRTPINAVLGLDEMILREADDDVILGYARDIQSSGKMLLSIINDILDFSKIEAGKMEIIPVDYDLSLLVADLVNMISSRAEEKGLSFNVNVAPDCPHLLHGDDTRLKQCMLNILTNAVKYTRAGSVTLEVSATQRDDSRALLFVSVADTGIGIKAEDIEKLYSPFERIEERRNKGIEGTGLGMSIVQRLLKAMGGQLSVQSEYGAGSVFSFSVEQEVRSWERIGDWKATKEKCAANASGYAESFQAPEAKILVVDDTPLNLTVVRGLLKSTRIQIDTAGSAAEALELAHDADYQLIFADHLMPKMNGIEMLHALRADSGSKNQHTVVIRKRFCQVKHLKI